MPNLVRRPGVWIVVALLAAAAVVFALQSRGPLVTTTTVLRRDLEQHLVASGRVRVPTRVQVASPIPGLVVAVGAVEGQRVAAQDLLVQLEDSSERAAVQQAEAAVKQAKARVLQLEKVGTIVSSEALRQAESNLARAEATLERTTKLTAAGALPTNELDNARNAVEVARAQRNAAQAQQVASAPAGADSRLALAGLLQAEAQLTGAKARLEQIRILAVAPGTVLSRSVEAGDVVDPSRQLMELAVDGDVQLVCFPDERNLAWLRIGQAARASADAYPQQVFDARVSYIAPSVDPERGSIEVRLEVPSPPVELKPDMTVSIDLTVASRKSVLTLQSEAVRDAATATPHVFVVEGGRVARRDVGLGIRGEGAVEIVSGLSEESMVILPTGPVLRPGKRVRVEGN